MTLVKYKTLNTLEEFRLFANGYKASFSNKKLAPKHPIQAQSLGDFTKVIGAFINDRMVAGYVVNNKPVRSFGLLSKEEREKLSSQYLNSSGNCEIASVWRNLDLPKNKLNGLWNKITKDILSLKPKRIFSSCYKGHGMFKYYSMMNPEIVHLAKEDTDNHIFYYSKFQFLCLMYIASIPRRLNYFFWNFRLVNLKKMILQIR